MEPPKAAKYLYDIRQACDKLTRFCAGKSFGQYESDELLRSAVERQFMIIGEAMAQMTAKVPDIGSEITEAGNIVGFRNRLIHGYSMVSDQTVWEIVEKDLPQLAAEVETLLKKMS